MKILPLKFLFLLLITPFLGFSQELPSIVKYSSEVYGAGNQNWMLDQDKKNFIYIANNEGLLEFNGANWRLYPSPNETILRSVKVIENVVYTGCYMEFGFWIKNQKGILEYTSLSKKIKGKLIDDEQFWNIINYDHWVIFQSLNRIYIYDTKTKQFKIITPKSGILKSFKAQDGIYFQTVDGSIFEIENGNAHILIHDEIIKNKKVLNIFSSTDGILIQTQYSGFYKFIDGNLVKWATEADALLNSTSIYSSIVLNNGNFALGTISNGIFIISPQGKTLYHITQNQGLSNNTVLSLFEDREKNLWIGLDNGIDCLNISSPIKTFFDKTGILGTVYSSIVFKDKIYVGTNQGLFYKNYNSNEQYQIVSGTKGQVWSLFEYDNTLFCGHDSGTLTINHGNSTIIYNQSGTWKFQTFPNNPNKLMQGNYSGISILEKTTLGWKFKSKIVGFDYSSKFFEVNYPNEIIVSHEYKAIFRLSLNSDFSKVLKVETYKSPAKGKNAGLAKFNNTIIYASKEGIFKFNNKNKKFEKDPILSKAIENDEYRSGKLIVDKSDKLWLFTKNNINYFTIGKLSNEPKLNTIPIPYSLNNSMPGYENISRIGESTYFIGTTDGYYSMNINDLNFNKFEINMNTVYKNESNSDIKYISNSGEEEIDYKSNNLTFNFSVPEYNKYIVAEYQYLLEGYYDEWSEWSNKPYVSFKNLPFGDYTLKVRARVGNSLSENTIVYNFTINRPWYATTLAILIYLVIVFVIAFFVHKTYKSYYQNQKNKLIEDNNRKLELKEMEVEQELLKIKNEQLELDVNSKNRELAVSTMSLIKKNELLTAIKEDLKKTDDNSKNIKTVITTINKNISEEDTWDLFKEAFNNADKDFLKKIKSAHSTLTPNDLRLCAYLRLNLSSKEIAPLLNISVRSVEIKRYRLRKKMDLPHEQGLVEYILSI